MRILIFLLAFLMSSMAASAEPLQGKWQVVDASFNDIGHCLMTETLELTLTLQPDSDDRDGQYTERFDRDGDSGSCPRVGAYQTTFDVKLNQSVDAKNAYIATLTFSDCQQRGGQTCGAQEPISYKRIIVDRARNGIVFDGIFFSRIE